MKLALMLQEFGLCFRVDDDAFFFPALLAAARPDDARPAELTSLPPNVQISRRDAFESAGRRASPTRRAARAGGCSA